MSLLQLSSMRTTIGDQLGGSDLSGLLHATRLRASIRNANPLLYLCAFVMVASLVLGGGTRGGFLSDAILQLLAVPLLLVALWRIIDVPLIVEARRALWFCSAVVAIPLIQLVPLPPWLWTALPHRGPSVEAYTTL